VFGDSGAGDTAVLALAELVDAHYSLGFISGGVSVVKVYPPTEATAGDGERWYGLTVAIDYQNDT